MIHGLKINPSPRWGEGSRVRCPFFCFLALACACLAIVPAHAAPGSQAGTELQLAFWNIRDLSTNSRDATELRQITQGRRALLDADSIRRIESACRH